MRKSICVSCGAQWEFGGARGYLPKMCVVCRTEHNSRLRQIQGQRQRSYTYTCKGCGIEYHPKRSDAGANTYCTRECAFKDSKRRLDTDAFRAALRKGRARRFSVVEYRAHLKRGYRLTPTYWYKQRVLLQCDVCMSAFTKLVGNCSRCSSECQSIGVAAARRKERSLRKAKLRGLTAGTSIDPIAIFERDQWHCQGCGCWTPQDLRGAYHDNAPELDHKVPISKGGMHVESNVHLLCRACNGSKGSMGWGDWRAETGRGGID